MNAMNATSVVETAEALVRAPKGVLAVDESPPTMGRRLESVGLPNEPALRLAWRAVLLDAREALAEAVSGAIFHDETLDARLPCGRTAAEALEETGALAGVKADAGTKPMPLHAGETITEGLDGLPARMRAWATRGARFVKWRATLTIGAGTPSRGCVRANAQALARYAACAQEAGLAPIVEPEILMDGAHSLERTEEASVFVLTETFAALREARVLLEGCVLKPAMVLPGAEGEARTDEDCARATLRALTRAVPAACAGVAFLSGGQSEVEATRRLDAINRLAAQARAPWPLTFSYGRALQASALAAWKGDEANATQARACFARRARMNALAAQGAWREEAEAA